MSELRDACYYHKYNRFQYMNLSKSRLIYIQNYVSIHILKDKLR
jgi:hypothetical protein